jgi:hypothetical protein
MSHEASEYGQPPEFDDRFDVSVEEMNTPPSQYVLEQLLGLVEDKLLGQKSWDKDEGQGPLMKTGSLPGDKAKITVLRFFTEGVTDSDLNKLLPDSDPADTNVLESEYPVDQWSHRVAQIRHTLRPHDDKYLSRITNYFIVKARDGSLGIEKYTHLRDPETLGILDAYDDELNGIAASDNLYNVVMNASGDVSLAEIREHQALEHERTLNFVPEQEAKQLFYDVLNAG